MKAKKENVRNKSSARRKLIPAISMLTVSAIMLSTATYAWFTMNKEVSMTGLNMTATTGEGMDISLAQVEGNNISWTFTDNPADTSENSWNSKVVVGDYYSKIGLVAPSSSVNGTDFYDAVGTYNGGKNAESYTKIADTNLPVKLTTRDVKPETAQIEADTAKDSQGYYVDIPVHLRTNKVGEGNEQIYYKMTINNNEDQNGGKKDNALYKAVRVKFIPGEASTPIIAADNDYYTDGQAVGTSGSLAPVTVSTSSVFNSTNDAGYSADKGSDSGLTIPLAESAGKYGHLNFTVRIWLEGESESCYNDNAGQQWNIGLAFSMGEFGNGSTNTNEGQTT